MKQKNVDDLVPKPPLKEERLSSSERDALKSSQFALPKKRAYPIEDPSHARNALARVSQHGNPAEKKKVRSAVHKRYPSIGQDESKATKIVTKVLEMEYPGVGNDPSSYVPAPENFAMGRVSPDEVDMGRRIEMEHTDDPEEAERIAMDHLAEDPEYYTKLHRAGLGHDTAPPKSYMVGSASATGSMTGTTSGSGSSGM